jgi:hypothetical protein
MKNKHVRTFGSLFLIMSLIFVLPALLYPSDCYTLYTISSMCLIATVATLQLHKRNRKRMQHEQSSQQKAELL